MQTSIRHGKRRNFPTDLAAHRAGMWVLAGLLRNDEARAYCDGEGLVIRAQGESTNTAGGFLVPDEMMPTILSLRELNGSFRQHAEIVPMHRDRMNWPRRSYGSSGLAGGFTAEGAAAADNSVTFDQFVLVAKKLTSLSKISTELNEDSAADLGEWFAAELAYVMALKEDQSGWNGDGTLTYYGIRGITTISVDGGHNAGKITAAAGHDLFSELDAADMGALMGAIPNYAQATARWFISAYGYGQCFGRIAATSGALAASVVNGKLEANFLGFPVSLVPSLPGSGSQTGKVMIAFGDLSMAAAIGDRREVTVKTSTHRYMDTDQIGILGTERVDINCHDLGDNTNPGPIVVLIGA